VPTADYEIDVNLEKDSDGILHAIPRNIPEIMFQGKTAHFRSMDGEVTIEFNESDLSDAHSTFHSPFLDLSGNQKTVISSMDGPIPLSNKGIFFCHCFITPPGSLPAARIGWGPNSPQSGGNAVVK
jgi:hypothetical protein